MDQRVFLPCFSSPERLSPPSSGISVKNMTKDENKIIDQLWGLQKILEDVQELVEDEKGTRILPSLIELEEPDGLPRGLSELKILDSKV